MAVQLCADDNVLAARLAHRRRTEPSAHVVHPCSKARPATPKDELKSCANPTKGACLDVSWPVPPSPSSPRPPQTSLEPPPVSTDAPSTLSACSVLHTPAPAKRSPYAHGPSLLSPGSTHEQGQFVQLVGWMARHLPRLAHALDA